MSTYFEAEPKYSEKYFQFTLIHSETNGKKKKMQKIGCILDLSRVKTGLSSLEVENLYSKPK